MSRLTTTFPDLTNLSLRIVLRKKVFRCLLVVGDDPGGFRLILYECIHGRFDEGEETVCTINVDGDNTDPTMTPDITELDSLEAGLDEEITSWSAQFRDAVAIGRDDMSRGIFSRVQLCLLQMLFGLLCWSSIQCKLVILHCTVMKGLKYLNLP